ncbi:LapA family protein [Litoribrevibacter albus]|uniref:Lipopolysaccharide assembly protein A domain-containing protein n=1 Tax=Litoribrevibacter albus TaxID=1473156 RepID=A0AA37S882_9GAMM|nr:LapA family protein [Litoribrevibacter albus]GLQ30121.1 hypothetical protein GCM10007876_05990 [Litoribrevibacter albus]
MRFFKLVFFILLMVFVFITGAVFVGDNPVDVNIRFYRWQLSDIHLPVLLLGIFSIGLLTGAFATGIRILTLQSKLALMKRQLSLVEKERDKLRLLGLKE